LEFIWRLGFGYWSLINMDILIFDMDGVLIDVSNSYRKTIQRTVHIYLETCLGFESEKGRRVTEQDISLFKSVGGFNNDWDLTSGLLLHLLSISGIPPSSKRKKNSSIEKVVLYLKKESSKLCQKKASLFKKRDLSLFLEKVKSLGGGLRGVRRALRSSWDGWVYGSGDLDQENVVKRIFQEVYLGEKFTSYYHFQPLFYRGQGLYLHERLLIPRQILLLLRKKLHMGIASGRPRFEAILALERFHLLPYFGSVVTLDECIEEEARIFRTTGKQISLLKPHPYSLLRVVQEINIPNPRCGYLGDVVDDMRATQSAKKNLQMLAIGFISGRNKRKAMKESLLSAGADLVIENPIDLLQFIS
jgi:phosphoglycolate phosphatase-like HAD superfamily hydrolase